MKLCLVCNFQFGDEQELCPKDMSKLVPLGKDPLIGKIIQDRYRIDAIVAKGSMGIVYKATQELIGREVAIKVLHGYLVADEESLKRFHKEAKAASRLNHPNITTLYDYGVLGTGQPYIVMDLLRGTNLSELLRQRDYLPVDEALPIFKQVCSALGEAHKRGVVHRDIKPENIVLEANDKGVSVKVVDFGIAKFAQEVEDTLGKITKTGTVCGSPTYMSPEQCDDNRVDHRSDIYSLGVVFYETITGRVPFNATDIYHVMTMHVKDPPPPLKQTRPDLDFPAHMEATIQKTLAKDPDARYQSIEEFWEGISNEQRVTRMNIPDQEFMTVGAGGAPSISEAEVQSVIAKAMQKRLGQTGETGAAIAAETGSQQTVVDPEVIRNKIAAATLVMQKQKERGGRGGNATGDNHRDALRNKARQVGFGSRFVGWAQQMFPAGLTLALCGALLWVVANESLIHTIIDKNIKPMIGMKGDAPAKFDNIDVDTLIAQSKFDQARAVLEKRKKANRLSDEDADTLNAVYIRLAKKEAKARHFKQAVALLDMVSGELGESEEVKSLIKKYKKSR